VLEEVFGNMRHKWLVCGASVLLHFKSQSFRAANQFHQHQRLRFPSNHAMRRVVVTGLGLVTPLGLGTRFEADVLMLVVNACRGPKDVETAPGQRMWHHIHQGPECGVCGVAESGCCGCARGQERRWDVEREGLAEPQCRC
jgi:hypothetical protein